MTPLAYGVNMYLKTRGIVLREVAYHDSDKLLTILTEEYGKLTVKARGVSRKQSPLKGPCQLLTYSEFTIFEYRGFHTVNEAQTLEQFWNLRNQIELFALASYFAQVSEVISQEDSPSSELLSLLLNCLYGLSQLKKPQMQVKAVFELRSACLAGYEPDLTGCERCANPAPQLFNILSGTLQCTACAQEAGDGLRLPISPGTLQAMRYIVYSEKKKLFSFRAGEPTLEELNHITEAYLAAQLERSFFTLDFYKSLLPN